MLWGRKRRTNATLRAKILFVASEETARADLRRRLGAVASVAEASSIKTALRHLSSNPVNAVVIAPPISDSEDLAAVQDIAMAIPARSIVVIGDFDESTQASFRSYGARDVLSPALSERDFSRRLERALDSEETVRLSEIYRGHLQSYLSAIADAVLVHAPSGRMIAVNKAATEQLVLPLDEVLFELPARRPVTMITDDRGALHLEEFPIFVALRTGESASGEMDILNDEGVGRRVISTATPIARPGDDRPTGVVNTFRDVTEERAAQQALRNAERRELILLERATEGYVVVNAEGRVTDASPLVMNRYALELFGTEQGTSLVHAEDLDEAAAAFERALAGEPVMTEIRLIDRRGDVHWVEATFTNRFDEPSVQGVVVNVRDVTVRHHTLESMARLSAIVEFSDDAIYATDIDGMILSWNKGSETLFGYSAEEAIGQSVFDLIFPEDGRGLVAQTREMMLAGQARESSDRLRVRKNGTQVYVSVKVSPVYDQRQKLIAVSTIARDVTERRQLEAAQRQAEERFRLGFERGPVGIAIIDDKLRFVRVNQALCQMLGREEREMVGHHTWEFVHRDDLEISGDSLRMVADGELETLRADRQLLHRDGSAVWVTMQVTLLRGSDNEPPYLFAQVQDISEQKRGEQALAHLALHDSLTGLPNRAMLSDRIAQALHRAQSTRSLIALLFLDIDRFKLVNDGLGHVAGDQLLKDLASRLSRIVRDSDIVARFGGDEFIIVIEDVLNETAARELGERVLALFDEPFLVEGQQLVVSASCGVVVTSGNSSSVEVLRDADAAMYRAKALGGRRIEVFDETLRAEVARRYEIERELAFALERGELAVAFQPVLSITGDELVGAEALVRWNSREWGPLLPSQFMYAAEESGLVVAIGEFVSRESLKRIVSWRQAIPGAKNIWVSVNISARHLVSGDPATSYAQILNELGASPDALRIELTESSVMADVDVAVSQLNRFRELGVKIAIDDFGTGLSSLSYLSRLPVQMLKIDQSLVAAPQSRKADSAIVQSIASLSRALDLELCAEGVESEAQRAALERLGCDLGQGYLFAPPMAPEQFLAWAIDRQKAAHRR
jgi:diguanylate cyclase (GGDEF)-like protein/PAS domain S-box-containing protein